jgi:hypothetical protein
MALPSRPALAVACAAVLTGCGGSNPPHFARADAAPLITLSHRIGGESACAQARDIRALQRSAARLVGAHKVPSALQATFLRGVNALAAQTPPCVPAAPPISTPAPGRAHGHGKHGHGHGGGD